MRSRWRSMVRLAVVQVSHTPGGAARDAEQRVAPRERLARVKDYRFRGYRVRVTRSGVRAMVHRVRG